MIKNVVKQSGIMKYDGNVVKYHGIPEHSLIKIMKFIALAALLGFASAHRLRYAESEGPTKADNGENDEDIMPRNGIAKWGNPLYWKDSGDLDDTVVLQTDGTQMVLKARKRDRATERAQILAAGLAVPSMFSCASSPSQGHPRSQS